MSPGLLIKASTATAEPAATTPTQTPAVPSMEPTQAAPAGTAYAITTTPGQYVWPTNLQGAVANTLLLKTTIKNDPATTAPYAIIALSESNNNTPAYTINIEYQPINPQNTVAKYRISVIKRGQATMPGSVFDITLATNQKAWDYLESWRTGTEKIFVLNYLNGTFVLSTPTMPLWHWTDATPLPNITRMSLASATAPLNYTNSTVTNTVTANATEYLGLNGSQPTILTFKTNTLAQTISCKLFKDSAAAVADYELLFDTKAGPYTRLTHRTSFTNSDILNSNGAYEINAPVIPAAAQTYFITYLPTAGGGSRIVFGLLSATNEVTTLLSWDAPTTNTASMNLASITSSTDLLTITNSTAPLTTTVPPLGLTKQDNTYTVSGMAKAAAYAAGTTNWDAPLTLAQPDNGFIQFDLELTNPQTTNANGAVILLGTQSQGQPLYGIVMEPNGTQARFRIFSLAQGVIQYFANEAVVNNHVLQGTYKISYAKSDSINASITIDKIDGANSVTVAKLSLTNARSGIQYAALSSDRATVTYSNVNSAPTATAAAAPTVGTITRTSSNGFDFNWNDSALQRAINTDAGLTFESQITFSPTSPYKTIVFGFAGNTINLDDKCKFNSNNQVFTGFAGAKIILVMTINETSADIALYQASIDNATSTIVAQTTVPKTATTYPTKIWIAYANIDSNSEAISIGLSTDTYTAPLYTWNNTRTALGSRFTKNNFKKIAVSSWATSVTYSGITLSAYAPPAIAAPAAPTTPVEVVQTVPNTLNRGLNAPLVYDWTLSKTAASPQGIALDNTGGCLSALVKINSINPSNSIATIMIGLSSNITQQGGMRAENKTIFTGADYNLVLQATPQAATPGFVCVKKVATTNDSPELGAQMVPALQQLVTPQSGTTTFGTFKLWARYTPYNGKRYFDVGLVPAADTRAISSLEPLYSYTEVVDNASSVPALTNMTISTWNTSAEITEITVVPNGASGAYNGTIVSGRYPLKSQWNQAATPATCYEIKPNTIHQYTVTGGPEDQVILALCKNIADPAVLDLNNPLYRISISSNGIILYDATNTELAKSNDKQGAITPTASSYWITADAQAITVGGYSTDEKKERITYATWSDSVLGDTKSWFLTYGATEKAVFEYKSAEVIPTTPTANGVQRPLINRSSRSTATTTENTTPRTRRASQPAEPQRRTANNRPVVESDEIANSRFRRNIETRAQ